MLQQLREFPGRVARSAHRLPPPEPDSEQLVEGSIQVPVQVAITVADTRVVESTVELHHEVHALVDDIAVDRSSAGGSNLASRHRQAMRALDAAEERVLECGTRSCCEIVEGA